MTTTISKWGNSQGIRLPKDIIETLRLHIGDKINLKIEDEKVILEPIKKDRIKYNLDDLIDKIPNDYTPSEEIKGTIGKEEW
jgi:antitoxin MazE